MRQRRPNSELSQIFATREVPLVVVALDTGVTKDAIVASTWKHPGVTGALMTATCPSMIKSIDRNRRVQNRTVTGTGFYPEPLLEIDSLGPEPTCSKMQYWHLAFV